LKQVDVLPLVIEKLGYKFKRLSSYGPDKKKELVEVYENKITEDRKMTIRIKKEKGDKIVFYSLGYEDEDSFYMLYRKDNDIYRKDYSLFSQFHY